MLLRQFLKVVDFRSHVLAFRGTCGEPPRREVSIGVSPVPLIPQESRTLGSNQLVMEEIKKMNKKEHTFKIFT
ncbi:hypothetical protein EV282_0743 [Fictibacillus sp. BK138]|nr:hypothetical protein EV282_0743 [Fictibacillus sp. BK138]